MNFDKDYIITKIKGATITCDGDLFTEVEEMNFYTIGQDWCIGYNIIVVKNNVEIYNEPFNG